LTRQAVFFSKGERAPPKLSFFDTSKLLKCQKKAIFGHFFALPTIGAQGGKTKEQIAMSKGRGLPARNCRFGLDVMPYFAYSLFGFHLIAYW